VAAILQSMLGITYDPKRLDATDGMAVAVCHYFTTCSTINALAGSARAKGLGGKLKATSSRGSSSWEQFLRQNPDRELKSETAPRRVVKKPIK
jgi:crossover junction endodeoxyribonuclease RuvC